MRLGRKIGEIQFPEPIPERAIPMVEPDATPIEIPAPAKREEEAIPLRFPEPVPVETPKKKR